MPTHRLIATFAALCVGLPAAASAKNSVATPAPRASKQVGAKRVHTIAEGESLWSISRIYGCTVDELKAANGLADNTIYPGADLTVPRQCGAPATAVKETAAAPVAGPVERVASDGVVKHTIASGDTLFRIAQRYDTTVDDIRLRNGLTDNTIYPGDRLRIVPGSGKTGRAIIGQSVGLAHRGRLVNASRLRTGRGYHIRRPTRAFGANHVVHAVERAVQVVRRRHPKVHALAIGDISAKKGGHISGHRSHQSGRDVDIGFYFKRRPKSYPKEFVVGTKKNLDLAATWTLVSTFAGMADADHGVERIFLGYEMQKVLYDYAKSRGVSKATLGRMFQYPHGRGSASGIIRHEPAHNDHIHVRFKCPAGDKDCK